MKLLTPEMARLWLDHLHTVMLNRKRGAKRAAETRAKTKLASTSVPANSQSGNSLNPHTPPSTATAVSSIQAEQPMPTTTTLTAGSETESYHCGTCRKEYQESGDSADEFWIGCDLCDQWYCSSCERLCVPPQVDIYLCIKCRQ